MTRPNFKEVQSQLDTLESYASQAYKYNLEDWPFLKDKCNGIIYELGGNFELIYNTGRDLAVFISSRFGAFYDVGTYPTLKSFVDSFDETWLNQINILEGIASSVNSEQEKWQNNWAYSEMVQLFEKEIEILRASNTILIDLRDSNTYRNKSGLPKKIKMKKQKFNINATNVQVGDNNQQQIVQAFSNLVEQIQASGASPGEKKHALKKLSDFINHPLVSSLAGGALGAIIDGYTK